MDLLRMDSMTAGYVAAMQGLDPDERLAHPGSSYEKGWLKGYADREAGKQLPRFHGFCDKNNLPIKPGMTITIPKGTKIRSTHPDGARVAARDYKVKVNHILPGAGMWENGNAFRMEIVEMINPSVVWAGTGGYWMEVDMNDVPEAR